jgi:hemoglobin
MPIKARARRAGHPIRMSEVTPFERIGGAVPVRALAERFYALIDRDPVYADLRAAHGPDLAPIAVSLAGFLTAWLGGPRDWFAERPGICIMRMHRQLDFGPALAAQWATAMREALAADPALDADIAGEMGDALTRMAHAMVVPRV